MRSSSRLVVVSCVLLALARPAGAVPEGFDADEIASLRFPTQMAFTPSGRTLFVNERGGRIRVIQNGKLRAAPFATVETSDFGEGGLLGIALDPRFDDGEPWVYVFHSSADGSKDVVSRIRADGLRGTDREILIDDIPAARIHHGGVIAFGPDGKLYVTNGEHADPDVAQDPQRFGGKVYRINPDGSVPDDNPFPGSRTWSYGHRNMFGIAFDPEGRLWISENGPNANDEINLIRKGRNYGWPRVQGDANDDRFVDPVIDYEQIVVPTGIAFANDSFPERYRGDLFIGTYGQATIRRVRLDGTRVVSDTVFEDGEQVVGLLFGPDGLYVTTPTAVMRIRARGVPRVTPTPTPTSATTTGSPAASPTPTPAEDPRGLVIGLIVLTAFGASGFGLARVLRQRAKQKPAR